MNKIATKISIITLLIIVLSACNTVKKVPTAKYLLIKNTLTIDGVKAKPNDDNYIEQINQHPNTSIVGINLRLHLYNLANDYPDSTFKQKIINNPKRYKRLSKWLSEKQVHRLGKSFYYYGWHNFLKKTGEPPVVVDSIKTIKSTLNLESLFKNMGYLRATAKYNIEYKKKKATVHYTITKGQPYYLDSIKKNIPNKVIDSLYQSIATKSYIRTNEPFNDKNFTKEIARLSQHFSNNGVYQFQQQDINFTIDTSYHKAPVTIEIKDRKIRKADSTLVKPYKLYTIGKVNIFIFNNKFSNTIKDSITYHNFHFYSNDKIKYNPKAITNAIFIQENQLFSNEKKDLTLRSLSNLRIFNSRNIQFAEKEQKLDTKIIVTTKEKISFKASADFTHSNIQDFGITGYTSLGINNVFKNAEILELGLKGNLGSSKDFANPNKLFFNVQEYGANLKLSFPRLFLPFATHKIVPKTMFPNSSISAGFSKQNNIGLDKENFTTQINYHWTPSSNTTIKFDLINLQYVKNINTDNYFNVYSSSYNTLNTLSKPYTSFHELFDQNNNLSIKNGGADLFMAYALNNILPDITPASKEYKIIKSINERKERLTENNLILSSNFNYFKSSKKDYLDKNFFSIRAKLESAGNALSLFALVTKKIKNLDGTRSILGLEYSQYVKAELEYIKYWNLRNTITLAFRGFGGLAVPYGNATSIPFARSFFAGGANDNRAWQSYSLGPGNANNSDDFNEANMKLSFNTELRFDITKMFKGALFADCGNIWNVNLGRALENDERKLFENFKSFEKIALGTGVGLRMDFNFFILRADWGFKTYNPVLEPQKRWFTDFKLNKSAFNIGINYPF